MKMTVLFFQFVADWVKLVTIIFSINAGQKTKILKKLYFKPYYLTNKH